MPGLTHSAARLALGLALVGAPAHTASRAAPTEIFDVYAVGVRFAELTITDDGGSRVYTIRKKNVASNQWGPAVTASESAVARDTAFSFSRKNIVASLASLRTIQWSSLRAVGWPDANTIYVRHTDLREVVNGRTVSAARWVQRDASEPLDFVFGDDDRLIAAVDMSHDVVLVRRGYERFTTVGRWRDPKVSQPLYGYRALPQAMVPMSDGVKLATLVYLPAGDISGPFPVVFIRTPYGIGSQIQGAWPYAARGYALVFQAVRGTSYLDPQHRSEGVLEPMVNEPKDGAEALAWITKQSWSNGKICMEGVSYSAYTQWAATMAGNPALKCIVPGSSMGTAFAGGGGTFGEGGAYYIFWMLNQPILPNRTWTEILHHRPLRDLDRFATGKELPEWKTLMDHSRNDEYWRRQDWINAKVPRNFGSLQISGWFDDDFPGTESNWALTQRTDSAPRHLVIGPWRHGSNQDRALNGFSFGPDALRDDVGLLMQQTYDHFLKGVDNGVEKSKVDYFLLGANTWRTASQWPPAEAKPQNWYFHSKGDAQRLLTTGSLTSAAPTGAEPPDRYVYDPKTPPPNWMSFDQMKRFEDMQTFPYDFKDIESRPDVVTFTSPPLEQDLTIAGDVMLVLYASTDVRDTDWWVHLSDVDSSGQSMRLTTGVLRARFRDVDDKQHQVFGSNFEHERLLSGDPQEVVRYDIGLRSIANTFKKGHRIRVAIMNALDNYSFPNSNTGKNEATVTETVVGKMAVHHSPGQASHIVLPVMPRVQPASGGGGAPFGRPTWRALGANDTEGSPMRSPVHRSSLHIAAALCLAACAPHAPAAGTERGAVATSTPDSGAFEIAGDPRGPGGAPWSFRGSTGGVRYELTGVLLVPAGPGPFPAVILSHGSGGSARLIANEVGRTMMEWGFVCIAADYTHAVGVPVGAPGERSETGASRANVLRAHMTRALLRRLPDVDNARVAAHGHSLGAYLQVAWLAAYPGDVQVASQTGGGIRPPGSRIAPAPTVEDAEHVIVPYQLHHGSADETVPLSWDERLARVLSDHGVATALYVYPGGHLVPRANPLMFERVRAWYAAHGVR